VVSSHWRRADGLKDTDMQNKDLQSDKERDTSTDTTTTCKGLKKDRRGWNVMENISSYTPITHRSPARSGHQQRIAKSAPGRVRRARLGPLLRPRRDARSIHSASQFVGAGMMSLSSFIENPEAVEMGQ